VRFEERFNSRDKPAWRHQSAAALHERPGYNTSGNGRIDDHGGFGAEPHAVNETRFQYYRNYSASAGNEIPSLNVTGAFVTGGNAWEIRTTPPPLELTNFTLISHGTHTIKWAARAER